MFYQWRIQDFPFGGGGAEPLGGGGADLQCRCFSVKTYVKMKELDPFGGMRTSGVPLDPPVFINIHL